MTTELVQSRAAEDARSETSIAYMMKLAAPMIVTNISFTVMQFVDRLMVSRLGTDALAAVLPAGFLCFVPGSFAIGVSTSINTFVSQSLGRGNLRDCSSYCWQAIYMGMVYAIITASVLWVWAPHIFHLMGHPEPVIVMEVTYLRILLYSQIWTVLIWSCSQFFMGVHRPVITMYASLVGQVINVFANYVLIFGKFGAPAMGIAGAGWGTFMGVAAGAVIRFIAFLTGDTSKRFQSRASLRIDFSKMGGILRVGIPAGIAMAVNVSLWGMCLFWLVGMFGKESLAATSAVFACVNVSVMPIVGISTALTAAVGRSIGMGHKGLAMKQTSTSLRIAVVYMGLAGVCFFFFREHLMHLWSDDRQVIGIGMNLFICAAIFQIFDAATIIYTGALRGAGDTRWLAAISAFSSTIILGLGGYFLVQLAPEFGAVGPWIACTANVIFVGLANRWRFKSMRWAQINIFRPGEAGIPLEIESVVD
ncbi:MAG: MATE family efflux transporter [Planctomycetota bacterium]